MSDRVFLDTNILVHTLGQRDDRTPKHDALLADGGVVSVQVLNELASVASRKLRMSWPEVTAALAEIKILCPSPIPITAEIHGAALLLAVRHGYHIYDALIVAAALERGVQHPVLGGPARRPRHRAPTHHSQSVRRIDRRTRLISFPRSTA